MRGKNSGKSVQLTDNIKFINADCMDIMAQYPDKYFDLAIVDPPYGSSYDAIGLQNGKGHKAKRLNYKVFENLAPSNMYFDMLCRVSRHQIIWGGNFFGLAGGCIVWNKNGSVFGDGEVAICSTHNSVKIFEYTWNGMLQGDMKNKEERIHPTQKPVKLYEWIYHNYAKPEYKILDTHLGSGSNAIAAHNYGISEFVGIELDPEYYADSIKRFNRVTAQLRMF